MCGQSRNLDVKSVQFLSNSHPLTDKLICKEGHVAEWGNYWQRQATSHLSGSCCTNVVKGKVFNVQLISTT